MTIYVTRHGETGHNNEGRYQGRLDIPLNETGRKQATQLAKELKDKRIELDVIVSSPLIRAKDTADVIAEAYGLPVDVIDEFTERDVGAFAGLTHHEATSRYPEIWAQMRGGSIDAAPDGGESIRQMDERVAEGMAKVTRRYAGKRVLIVCHGFTARVINRQLNNIAFEDMHSFSLGNCEIAEYHF